MSEQPVMSIWSTIVCLSIVCVQNIVDLYTQSFEPTSFIAAMLTGIMPLNHLIHLSVALFDLGLGSQGQWKTQLVSSSCMIFNSTGWKLVCCWSNSSWTLWYCWEWDWCNQGKEGLFYWLHWVGLGGGDQHWSIQTFVNWFTSNLVW